VYIGFQTRSSRSEPQCVDGGSPITFLILLKACKCLYVLSQMSIDIWRCSELPSLYKYVIMSPIITVYLVTIVRKYTKTEQIFVHYNNYCCYITSCTFCNEAKLTRCLENNKIKQTIYNAVPKIRL
jgi:hypothetical protein